MGDLKPRYRQSDDAADGADYYEWVVTIPNQEACRDCAAEGFRLTDGRCDGCHAQIARKSGTP